MEWRGVVVNVEEKRRQLGERLCCYLYGFCRLPLFGRRQRISIDRVNDKVTERESDGSGRDCEQLSPKKTQKMKTRVEKERHC